jgi:phage-related minor tail protein
MTQRLATAVIELSTDSAPLLGGLDDVKARISSAFDGGVKGLTAFGKEATNLGKTLSVGLTAPIVGIGAAAIAAGVSIDDAFDALRSGTGATGEALTALEGSFRTVFKAVPNDAAAVATALADLNTRTGATGATLETLATQLLTLARLTGSEVAPLIASTTRLFGDWSVSTEQQAGSLDLLWRIAQSTGVGVDTLAQQLVQFGAPLRAVGIDLETSAALLGKWEKEGVNAELVMGSLRIAANHFSKEGVPLNEGLRDTIERIKGMASASEAGAAAAEVFGARAGTDMAAAIREGRFEVDDLLTSLRNSDETIMTAARATDGFAEKWAVVKNNLVLALEPLGTRLLGVLESLQPLLIRAAGAIASLSERFSNLSPLAQGIVLAVGGLAAAIGPALVVVGTLATGLAAIAPWFAAGTAGATLLGGALAVLTGPIGLAAAAISGLALVWATWGDDITRIVTNTFISIKTWLWDRLGPVLTPIGGLLQSVGAMFQAFGALVGAVGSLVFTKIGEMVTGIGTWLRDRLAPIIEPAKALVQSIATVVGAVATQATTFAKQLYDGVKMWLLDKFTEIVDGVKAKIDAVTGAFRMMYDKVVGHSYVPDMVTQVGAEIAKLDTLMVGKVQTQTAAAAGAFAELAAKVPTSLRGVTDALRDAFGEQAAGIFAGFASGPLGDLFTTLDDMFGGKLGGIVNTGVSIFQNGFKAASGIARVFAGDFTGLMDAISGGWALVQDLGGKIAGFFKGLFGGPSAKELAGREIVSNFEQNISQMLTETQRIEAGGDAWKQTVILVRDAYMAMGRDGSDALRDVEALWRSSKEGPEAVERAIGPIQTALDYVQREMESTGLSFGELRARGVAEAAALTEGITTTQGSVEDLGDELGATRESLLGLGPAGEGIARRLTDTIGRLHFDIPVTFDVQAPNLPNLPGGGGAIPMAGGGSGVVTRPTLFLAGEAGREEFAFSGAGRRFGSGGVGSGADIHAVRASIEGLRRDMVSLIPTLAETAARHGAQTAGRRR